jgi:hypothetical protein
MAQIVFNHVEGKPPHFDGTCYDYWKTKNDYVILDPTNPTPRELENKQCNPMALNTIYNAID